MFQTRLHFGRDWAAAYVESKNLIIERRYAAGDVTRLPQMSSDLVRLKVDHIVVGTNYIAEVTKRATHTIRFVAPVIAGPVGSGLAESPRTRVSFGAQSFSQSSRNSAKPSAAGETARATGR